MLPTAEGPTERQQQQQRGDVPSTAAVAEHARAAFVVPASEQSPLLADPEPASTRPAASAPSSTAPVESAVSATQVSDAHEPSSNSSDEKDGETPPSSARLPAEARALVQGAAALSITALTGVQSAADLQSMVAAARRAKQQLEDGLAQAIAMAQQQRDEVEATLTRLRQAAAISCCESAAAQEKAIEAQRQAREAQLTADQWQQRCRRDEEALKVATVQAQATMEWCAALLASSEPTCAAASIRPAFPPDISFTAPGEVLGSLQQSAGALSTAAVSSSPIVVAAPALSGSLAAAMPLSSVDPMAAPSILNAPNGTAPAAPSVPVVLMEDIPTRTECRTSVVDAPAVPSAAPAAPSAAPPAPAAPAAPVPAASAASTPPGTDVPALQANEDMLGSSSSPSLEAESRSASFAATASGQANAQANADGIARVASGAPQVSVPLPDGCGVSAPSVAAAAVAAPAAAAAAAATAAASSVLPPDVPSDWCFEVDGPADAFPCGDAARCRASAVLLGDDDPICKLLVVRTKGIGHQVRVHLKGQPARFNRWYAAKDLRNSAHHQQTVEELIRSARAPVAAAAAAAASSTPRTSRKRASSAAPVSTALHAAAGVVLSAHNAGAQQCIATDGVEDTHSLQADDRASKRRKLEEAGSPAAVV